MLDKHGYSDLSKITCKLCGLALVLVSNVEFAADSNDQQMPPLPRPQENIVHNTATVLEGNNVENDGEDGGAELVTDVVNEGEHRGPQKLTVRPDKFHKSMGKNAEVSVPLKAIVLLAPIKVKYPNTYKQMRGRFIVEDVKTCTGTSLDFPKILLFFLFSPYSNHNKLKITLQIQSIKSIM